MKRNIGLWFVIVILAMCVISCSNGSELKFLGMNLSVSCEEFEKHLENKGFKHIGENSYKGNFLGEEVDIVLENVKNGHHTKLTLMFVSDIEPGKEYYEKICKEIRKEHGSFKEKEKEKDDHISYTQQTTGENINIPINNQTKEYYNEAGKRITISYYNAAIFATIMVFYESDK